MLILLMLILLMLTLLWSLPYLGILLIMTGKKCRFLENCGVARNDFVNQLLYNLHLNLDT